MLTHTTLSHEQSCALLADIAGAKPDAVVITPVTADETSAVQAVIATDIKGANRLDRALSKAGGGLVTVHFMKQGGPGGDMTLGCGLTVEDAADGDGLVADGSFAVVDCVGCLRDLLADMTGSRGPAYATQVLVAAGWRPDDDGKWWRDGVWATARVGLINVKAIISPAEALAFAVLAERPA